MLKRLKDAQPVPEELNKRGLGESVPPTRKHADIFMKSALLAAETIGLSICRAILRLPNSENSFSAAFARMYALDKSRHDIILIQGLRGLLS